MLKEKDKLQRAIQNVQHLEQALKENVELLELAEQESDQELESLALREIAQLEKTALRQRLESLMSGEADDNACFLEVHSGAGGTEAQDWASMLKRMYIRWSERRGFKVDIADEMIGEEAGIKSVTLEIQGHQAYGWLKSEAGIHRLVRISPFDSNARRHTSFASVSILPIVDDTIDIQIEDKDLRVDTFRASGAGGQHVNKTESAIRITHIPTGIVVGCQTDRSQHRNRAQAMAMLKSKLYELEMRKRQEASDALQGTKKDMGWGNQIRSYVLQPYQMIKDLRTGVETSQTQAVLDGDIDAFLEAALAFDKGSSQ